MRITQDFWIHNVYVTYPRIFMLANQQEGDFLPYQTHYGEVL